MWRKASLRGDCWACRTHWENRSCPSADSGANDLFRALGADVAAADVQRTLAVLLHPVGFPVADVVLLWPIGVGPIAGRVRAATEYGVARPVGIKGLHAGWAVTNYKAATT